MGIYDDGPYIVMARTLASTGHIVYNGWAAPMLGWQLYLAAAFIHLFGFSFTTVRMSTLLVAVLMAFLLQRTLVRAGISERNATIGTLAFVLSPLYLQLSVIFMTDICGLFALVLCLYGCLRALQASQSLNDRSAIAWLGFAVLTNALCGTSRQIAWLGILVLLPSTLWLLRARRRVLLAGAAITFAGVLFILACMHWLKLQPYITTVSPFAKPTVPFRNVLITFLHAGMDLPFLLLPIMALFLPEIRIRRLHVWAPTLAVALLYGLIAIRLGYLPMQEPVMGDWVTVYGMVFEGSVKGNPLPFLHGPVRLLVTIASFGGLFGLCASLINPCRISSTEESVAGISWRQLSVLLIPFSFIYILFLLPMADIQGISDRYLLALLLAATIPLVRYYQQCIHPRLPAASLALVGIVAIFGVCYTHNTFAFHRAGVALAAELRAAGVPNTSVDNGWVYNLDVELHHANHLNNPQILVPSNAYVPPPTPPAGDCPMGLAEDTPHIHPLYSVSFDPTACYGPAPFAPIHYSRWPGLTPGTLYVVRSTPPSKP
jgi:hypothetical protein